MAVEVNTVTGTLGERVAERRDQAHQPFEPDLGKPHVVLMHVLHGAEDERRECDRQTVTMAFRLRVRTWSSFCDRKCAHP
jgi:hypothetical protein